MNFAAFISYKHREPDERWARWLHRKLETYRVPKGVPAAGAARRRIGRIFRDDDELRAGPDLAAAIQFALAASEYLIVLCSPAAAKSDYVNREVREFIRLGRQDRIVAVLIDGEPAAAFPPALQALAHEPLAADLRRSSFATRKQAFLKIAAALLNCDYDALRQRERLRAVRRLQLLAGAVAASVAFVVSVRLGVSRLSIDNGSVGTYHLRVRKGLPFLQPLLGSDEVTLELSDTLYQISTAGKDQFPAAGSLYFLGAGRDRILDWADKFYARELASASKKEAPANEFYFQQLKMTDKESKAILIGAVSQAFPVGLYYLIGQGIADEETKQALKKALDGAEPKAKALVLDTLDALFPESRLAHEIVDKTLSSCGADYVKIAKALAYDLRPQTASECARAFMAEKHGPDAAALIVRFGADVSIYQDWLSIALASDSADEFVPASEIVISRRMKTPAIVAALRGRLVDSRKEMKQAAALALWSLNETDAAISSLVLQSLEQPMASAPYVALMRSDLRDPAMVVSLQNHLRGVAAGDLTDGWLTSPPEALDVLKGYRSAGIVDICLKSQLSGRTEDWALSLLTARAVMLGCREPSVVNVLNSQLASGAPGLIGLMADVKLSEAYGRMLVDDMRGAFETKLTSLYQDLTSDRAEASANYRLAIEYGLADLVEDADTEPEQQARHVAVAKKLAGLKDDPAPYFRAAAVRTQQIIFDAVMRKKLLLLRTHS